MFRKTLTLALIATLTFVAPCLAQTVPDLSPVQNRIVGRCAVGEVAVFPDRTHIRCDNWDARYAAVPTDGSAFSNSVVDLALFALQTGRTLTVRVEFGNVAQNPAGCLPRDCRRILGIAIAP